MGDVKYLLWSKIKLRALLGFCALMGINSLPALKDYWKLDPAFHYAPIADRIGLQGIDFWRYLAISNLWIKTPFHNVISTG
jgi:hypothetical protein